MILSIARVSILITSYVLREDALKYLIYPAAYNLRSSMVRNALLCLEDLLYQEQGGLYLKEMIPLLVTRASHEKQFLREAAQNVLNFAIFQSTCSNTNSSFFELMMFSFFVISKKEKRAQVLNIVRVVNHNQKVVTILGIVTCFYV
jgi:hypothetical protein